jgi:hypothetical protein
MSIQPRSLAKKTTDTAGFYRLDPATGDLSYAPANVHGPNYTLLRSRHVSYRYPIHGWAWYDTREVAIAELNPEMATDDTLLTSIRDRIATTTDPDRLRRELANLLTD